MEGFRDAQLIPPLANMPFMVNHLSDQARGLVAWWPLTDLAGSTVECRIRAGNRGTVGSGVAAINTVRPAYIDGALGIEVRAQPTGNYIGTGFTDALDDFTATCWFRPNSTTFFGRAIDKAFDTGFAI